MSECRCDAGFGGSDCAQPVGACPKNCSGHGLCEATVSPSGLVSFGCDCEVGFAGADCTIVRGGCPGNCTGHGSCFNGTCYCDIGFTHDDCSLVTPTCSKNCSGHGRCADGQCDCHVGFGGVACDEVLGTMCPRNCTGHGACDESSATCVCDPGFGGADCGQASEGTCHADCSKRGTCHRGTCTCLSGYAGSDCSIACPRRCTHPANGLCLADGSCKCHPGYSGLECQTTDPIFHLSSALRETSASSMHALDLKGDFATTFDGTLWIFYPIAMIASCATALVVLFCCCGYLCNLREGHRGTQAIPFYRYLSASMSYSDYQLKRSDNPGM